MVLHDVASASSKNSFTHAVSAPAYFWKHLKHVLLLQACMSCVCFVFAPGKLGSSFFVKVDYLSFKTRLCLLGGTFSMSPMQNHWLLSLWSLFIYNSASYITPELPIYVAISVCLRVGAMSLYSCAKHRCSRNFFLWTNEYIRPLDHKPLK